MAIDDTTANGNVNKADRSGKPQNDQTSSDGQVTGEAKNVDLGDGLLCCSCNDSPVDLSVARRATRRTKRREIPRLRRKDSVTLTESTKEGGRKGSN